jgi:molybdopterin/thiamine biosynthesis adenylyltransferase
MRVFGTLGQKKLSYSKVLLVGADPVGVEAMKNLVLSGVSSICIIDN